MNLYEDDEARAWLSRSPLADVTDSVRRFRFSVGGSIESDTRPEGLRRLADPGSCDHHHKAGCQEAESDPCYRAPRRKAGLKLGIKTTGDRA